MLRPSRLFAWMTILGLVAAEVAPAMAQAVDPPAPRRPATLDDEFNHTLVESACTEAIPRYPFTETGYPFKVDRLRRALAATGLPARNDVGVIVFDNDFLGYSIDSQSDGDAEVDEIPLRALPNFPAAFFRSRGGSFNPYYFPDQPPTGIESREGQQIDAQTGHGTSIAGIILGGKYDGKEEPGQDPAKPSVRTLLMMEDISARGAGAPPPKIWLRISFVPVDYGTTEANSTDPNQKLGDFFKETDGPQADIVNMSFGRTITDDGNVELDAAVRGLLVVAAAGNSKRQVPGQRLRAKPISANPKGIMLVVASHDADGRLSPFSNFGESVTLAAPGCAIWSWTSGDGNAIPLSGTSMATAIVSFAAALVRSRWDLPGNVGTSLRNRLISSARLEPKLLGCASLAIGGPCTNPCRDTLGKVDCVRDGNMLDIEAAVLLNRDYIEYRTCAGDGAGTECPIRIAVGTVRRTPEFLGTCMEARLLNAQLYGGEQRRGLTHNGAIKQMRPGIFRVFYEPGQVGKKPIEVETCPAPGGSADETVVFQPRGMQLDGAPAAAEPIEVPISQVLRIVARAF